MKPVFGAKKAGDPAMVSGPTWSQTLPWSQLPQGQALGRTQYVSVRPHTVKTFSSEEDRKLLTVLLASTDVVYI